MGTRDGNKFLHILEAPGDIGNYKLFRMEGREAISGAEPFRLTIRSEGDVPPASAWLNASITFSLGMSDDSERRINGRCARFEHLYHKGSYVEFAILIEPAFAALRLTRDRRLFTDRSHKQVVETILGEHAVTFDASRYSPSATRAYIVQQDESDFDFVSRLMEDEGVFYYFRFDPGAAPYKHRMYIAGDTAGYYDGDPFELSFRRDHLLRGLRDLQMGYDSTPAAVITHDYDFAKPGDLSPVTAPSKLDWAARKGHVYHWGTGYTDAATGRERAKLRIEGSESTAVVMKGSGSYVAFAPGARFQVDDTRLDPRERRIVVRSVTHDAFDPYSSAEGEPHYEQSFEAQPSTQVYRPARRSAPPVASRGPQTAVVIDQTDPEGHGRIKVKFHWDRTGASTCWVRLVQAWAGDGIGAQFIPRPGMEVLVDFIDGRPDRPVVVGSLYNGRNKHSFAVPANLTQAGFRTYGEGGLVNEFLFEDKSGGEEIYLRAGRDFRREVVQDERTHIAGLKDTVVEKSISLFARGKIDIGSATSITLHVGGNRILIDGTGIWIDGNTVNLNCASPAPTATPVMTPIAASIAGGMAGAAPSPVPGPAAAASPSASPVGPAPVGSPAVATPAAPAPATGAGTPDPMDIGSKFGPEAAALAAKSPSLSADLAALKQEKWSLDYGPAGGGSTANRDTNRIIIDRDRSGSPATIVRSIAHEAGHARYALTTDTSSRAAYVTSKLKDEGAATLSNIRARREILAHGGTDIGLSGDPANGPAYEAAYDAFLKDGNQAKAHDTIGSIYGNGERTSNTRQSYSDYYGDSYDKIFPKSH